MSRIMVGTIGQSLWMSDDAGESWQRGGGSLFLESDIRALLEVRDGFLLAGAEDGVYVSTDQGKSWSPVALFPSPYQVWSLAAGPGPDGQTVRLWAGTCPAALFYSDDEGKHWAEAPARWLRTCAGGSIRVRVTTILTQGNEIWAGAEIDGIQYSSDGGKSWARRDEGLSSADIHDLAHLGGEGEETVLAAATNNDVCLTRNGGRSWEPMGVADHFEWGYCRSVASGPDGALLVGNGNGPPGSGGAIWGSRDLGKSWTREPLPGAPNSTIWEVAPAGNETWAYSVLGQVFHKSSGGWTRLSHEFGEVRAFLLLGQGSAG